MAIIGKHCSLVQIVRYFENKYVIIIAQCSHRLEKYLNLEGFLEKSLKNKSVLKKYWKITQKP